MKSPSRGEVRATAEALTVFVAASVAVLAIMLPISFAALASARRLDLLVFNIPRAMTGGAFVAVITAAITVAVGSARAARWTALIALSGILLTHLALAPTSDPTQVTGLSLPTLNFVDALLAGAALGALAVAVWDEPTLRTVFLFAVPSATILGDLTETPTDKSSAGFAGVLAGTLPLWFIGASVLALAYFALTSEARPHRLLDTAIPLAPVFAAVIAFSTILTTSLALADSEHHVLPLILGAVVVVAAATAAALILPDRDGLLLLLMTGFAVTGSLVITLPRSGWIDVGTVVAVGAGLLAGRRGPRPLFAAAAVVALAVFVLATDVIEPPANWIAALGCLALGAVCGYCVGCAVPASPASATVGLSILFVPSLGVALSDNRFGHLAYSSTWYRTADVHRDATPALIALVMACGCVAVIALLLRHRSEPS
ncbi:hypothetical protein [Nocardia asteroides]|uniref:hypothetical protein n=1 Tax=Nocardia asteroides TaxID=1824 RepID=UPI001E47C4C6|nr:hypothetical protein [Nocardia asteroides]UGT56936.1 hypothetical protein LTT85_08855 [Nocardia asteroides]